MVRKRPADETAGPASPGVDDVARTAVGGVDGTDSGAGGTEGGPDGGIELSSLGVTEADGDEPRLASPFADGWRAETPEVRKRIPERLAAQFGLPDPESRAHGGVCVVFNGDTEVTGAPTLPGIRRA